jgi:pantetheine-phosphate adenylyltransferase
LKTAVYPGSFDPITLGHMDIIKRASKIFDKVIVCVLVNLKKRPSFTPQERVEFVRRATVDYANVETVFHDGLLIDFMRQQQVNLIVKGLRAVSDFEYEFQMALANNQLSPDIETLFLTTSTQYSFLSSSLVREIASYGGALDSFVPNEIIPDIYRKLKK